MVFGNFLQALVYHGKNMTVLKKEGPFYSRNEYMGNY